MNRRLLKVAGSPLIAVEFAAPGPAELVFFLHGIGGNCRNWTRQLDAFGGQFIAAAWDARGYGRSEDYEGALVFSDFAQDLRRVLDAFGASKAHLVGTSMGGRIALDFYAKFPERVATLTLADTSAGNTRVSSPAEVETFLAIRKRPLLEGKTPREIAPAILATLVGPGTSEEVRAQMFDSLASLHVSSYLKTLDTVTRYLDFPPFETIKVPVLVLVGEHDRIATPEYARQMAAKIPRAQFAEIAGGSHVSNMDRAEDFNRLLRGFLSDHRTASATVHVPEPHEAVSSA